MSSEIRDGQEAPRGTSMRHETKSLGTTAILASVSSPVDQRDGSRPSTPMDRWLLFCLPFYEHIHKAVHIEVPLPISDQNLLRMLRKEYSEVTGSIRRLFGWKKVKKISFIQVLKYPFFIYIRSDSVLVSLSVRRPSE